MTTTTKTTDPKLTPRSLELAELAPKLRAAAFAVTIDSDEQFEIVGEDLKRVKAKKADLENERLSITRPMDTAKKRVMDFFRKPITFLTEAENAYKRALADWTDKKEREQREARRAAEAAAKAEQARIDDEAMQRAAEADAKGDSEQAEAILASRPHAVVPAMPERATPKVSGVSTVTLWRAEVVDLMLLAKAVADGKAPLKTIQANERALNEMARALQDTLNIPGVKAVSSKSVRAARS